MELKRVVVTGMGAVTPLGNTTEETWKNLIEGVSGAGPITHFDASLFKTQFACEVKDFNVGNYIDRKEARRMDLYTQYALAAAKMAVDDSGMDLEAVNKDRIGVVFEWESVESTLLKKKPGRMHSQEKNWDQNTILSSSRK